MMRAMSSGIAGLKAHQTAMDVVGNNIANVNTYGFKASSTSFRDTLYQTIGAASAGDGTTTSGKNASEVGYGATAASVDVNTGRSGMTSTGVSSDCYINGEGYYVMRDGTNGYLYSRVGEFKFDDAGYLTDNNGHYVLGQQNTLNADGTLPTTAMTSTPYDATNVPAAIHYDPNADTLKSISFASDGTITATNAAGQVVTIGKIAVATFSNPSGLTQEGDSYYKTSSNSGTATYSDPGSGSSGSLVSGALESSNVDLATELSNMIVYERGYQANTKIITASDEMLQTLVNMK